jgi:hypothetical protein
MSKNIRHYEEIISIQANADTVFAYADNFHNFSSHMNKSSWMMGGGKMETKIDEGKGQRIGSHIKMGGTIFGIKLYLDEIITLYKPPYYKAWKTVGNLNLLIIGHYNLGFKITPKEDSSVLSVHINYELPNSFSGYLLGLLFGNIYAKWCVHQMSSGVKKNFETIRN